MSNYATPPQLVPVVPYCDLDEMHAFAHRWRDENRGKWFIAPKLSGFCILFTRTVYDAIGGLDEGFGLGLFDDDDLAERARRAGFDLAVARDLFVHHFGSRTFVGNGIDAEALLQANERRFADKWGHDRPRGRRVALRPWKGDSAMSAEERRSGSANHDGGLRIEDRRSHAVGNDHREHADDRARSRPIIPPSHEHSTAFGRGPESSPDRSRSKPRVTLTMIVRDEETNLPHCLESVRGIFDEIVVVDTGSVDRTAEIARSFGARVFDFVWVDDFAAARNAALARATGDYAFWLDADDVVEPPQRETLRALLDGLRAGQETAFVVRCSCDPGEDGSGGETVVDHIRLFPLREDVRWTFRVHEQILPALRRARIPVRWTELTVRHTGYTNRAIRGRKLRRDARILREELADRPDDPFVLFNLGAIEIENKDWREALGLLRRSLAGSAPSDSITRKLYALIARAHQMLGEPHLALAACGAGLAQDPEDAELLFREAVVRRHSGDPDGAERCWRRILTLRRPEQFASLDQGIYGHLTRRNLAALAAERGDLAEADRLWAEVLADCPGDREAQAAVRREPATIRIH
jgi:GT2 family glycosyltransferase